MLVSLYPILFSFGKDANSSSSTTKSVRFLVKWMSSMICTSFRLYGGALDRNAVQCSVHRREGGRLPNRFVLCQIVTYIAYMVAAAAAEGAVLILVSCVPFTRSRQASEHVCMHGGA